MAYDYDRDRVVAFGGMNGNDILDDTYEGTPYWYSSTAGGSFTASGSSENIGVCDPTLIYWQRQTNTVSTPPARWGHSMVYDPSNQRILMFGGFDSNHRPLNDLWMYASGTWSEVRGFLDSQKPQPRGGASLVFFGGFNYNRGLPNYCVSDNTNNINKLVLFGGTDGRVYFNDTWVFDEHYYSEIAPSAGRRWLLVNPVGEQSRGPSPRAFASFVYAQNGRYSPDPDGLLDTYIGRADLACQDTLRCAQPAAYLFGGRAGLLPTSKDTDDDLVDDGVEYELGGPGAGRDPRVNALVVTNAGEVLPFTFLRIGSVTSNGTRGAIANLESLSYPSYDERMYAIGQGLPFEGHPEEGFMTNGIFGVGVEAYSPEQTNLWFHKGRGANPIDVWQLGVPDNSVIGTRAAPPHAYSGRWCFGTALNGYYPTNAIMDLYTPIFNLKLPSANSTSTNFNQFFLIFHEWLDLKDSNDVVRVEAIQPATADAVASCRKTDLGITAISLVGNRNNAFNTTGVWRRMIVPLTALANESNLFIRFTLQSDASGVAGGWYLDDIAIIQGARLSGTFTNAAGADVVLLGSLYNGNVQANTLANSSGYFLFDMLPFGRYQVGAISTLLGAYTLGPTNSQFSIGSTNLPAFVMGPIVPGVPTQISWPAVPGVTYEVQYSYDFLTWTTLADITAASATETYLDYSGDPLRFYRVNYLGAP